MKTQATLATALALLGSVLVAASVAPPSTSQSSGPEPVQQYDEPIGPRLEDGSFGNEGPADNDPRIDPFEVVAPSMDSRDAAWMPWYRGAEDPATIDCKAARDCEDYKVDKLDAEGRCYAVVVDKDGYPTCSTTTQTSTGEPK